MYILNQAFAQLLILLLYMRGESHSMIMRIVDRWNDVDMKERLKQSRWRIVGNVMEQRKKTLIFPNH